MSYFPLVVKYADRMFPETVKHPNDLRHSVGFRMVAMFKGLDTELEIERVKAGWKSKDTGFLWRVSDNDCYTVDSSKRRAVVRHFDSIAGH